MSKEREDYLKKQAEAQFAIKEADLVDAVRTLLKRHGMGADASPAYDYGGGAAAGASCCKSSTFIFMPLPIMMSPGR